MQQAKQEYYDQAEMGLIQPSPPVKWPDISMPPVNLNSFPKDWATRKNIPVATGVLDYFPLALLEVAKCSKAGNAQHNVGEQLYWDKTKSTDHADSLVRHLMERNTIDSDGIRHSAKVAWRALALLQMEMENENTKR